MNDDAKQQKVEAALRRRKGMDEASSEALTRHFESQDDLYTQCQKCGAHLTGTLAELEAHRCNNGD